MNPKIIWARISMVVLTLCMSVLLTSSPASVGAQEATQAANPDETAATVGTAFTYQGRLTDNGNPATGAYDFDFTLFNAASGGAQVGGALTKENVAVSDGYFTVVLDFGNNAFTGDERFLNVGVRAGNSTGGFTSLSPRQTITPSPYALALPGVITKNNRVGIGTTDPQTKLHVVGDRVRLESGGKRLDLATTGAQLDIISETNHLYLRTPNHFITLNPIAGDGDISLGNTANTTNVVGTFKTGGKAPILFKRYPIPGDRATGTEYDFPTGVKKSEYVCGIAGWAVIDVDVQENNSGDYIIETIAGTGDDDQWYIRVAYYSQDDHEDRIFATIICVDTQMASREGF